MRRGAISQAASAAVLLVVGILIGATVFYSSFALAGGTLTKTSTTVVTSTVALTVTSTTLTQVQPSGAIVAITNVRFPTSGTVGGIGLYNLGSTNTTVVSASLSYSGQTCYLEEPGSGVQVGPGASTLSWTYANGDACPSAPSRSGVQFEGVLTFANGAEINFAGSFQ